MADTPSKVSMISNASIRLGGSPVTSLNENTKAAVSGANIFESVYRSTLSKHRWRFAAAKQTLGRLAGVPLNDWEYAYQQPTDPKVLTIIKVVPRGDYELYEDKLYSNSSTLQLDYIFEPVTDNLPPYFVELMELRIAHAICIAVTGDKALKREIEKELVGSPNLGTPGAWAMAKATDASARPPEPIQHSPLIDARMRAGASG